MTVERGQWHVAEAEPLRRSGGLEGISNRQHRAPRLRNDSVRDSAWQMSRRPQVRPGRTYSEDDKVRLDFSSS